MPWLAKALLVALKTKRGRKFLLAGGVAAFELAQSKQARALYATARRITANPVPRQKAARLIRDAAARLHR